jgi:hypothetical protein
MPKGAYQPPKEGPAWWAFVAYWKKAKDAKGARACAWRAWYAAWTHQVQAAGEKFLPGVLNDG